MTALTPAPLTGRISEGPHTLLVDEVLAPQLDHDLAHHLPWLVRVEQVVLAEYLRMGLLEPGEVAELAAALRDLDPAAVHAEAASSMSDLAFAVERAVGSRCRVPPRWHVDRSRNDLQATAQACAVRDRVLGLAEQAAMLGRAVHERCADWADVPMPGYTHLQPAQVVSPAFYLLTLSEQAIGLGTRLDAAYRAADACPLGAGAMAGQELEWDRGRMAELMGSAHHRAHALSAVAGREWALLLTAELSTFGVAASRIVTDLMAWLSEAHGWLRLPDELAGISSAMPQKRNYPVMERIRGRAAHLTSAYLDVACAQRNTPFANTVEVSKEATAGVHVACDTAESVLRLLTAVVRSLDIDPDRMRAACERDHLGGFTLANALTLKAGVAWRTAQVLTGRYVVAATGRGVAVTAPDPALLAGLAADMDVELDPAIAASLLGALDVGGALAAKVTPGSVNPAAVRELTAQQAAELAAVENRCRDRRARIARSAAQLDRACGLDD